MFKTQKIQAATFGERLQRAREERKLDLSDVSRTLGVRTQYLEALEQGSFKRLPPRVYAKGLLRKYAQLLGIPADEVIRQFVAEHEALDAERSDELTRLSELAHQKRFVLTPKLFRNILACLVIFTALLYLWYQIQQFVGKPSLVITSPDRDVFTSDSSVVVSGSTDRNARVMINGEEIRLSPDAMFKEVIQLKEGLNTIEVVSTTRLGKQMKIVRRIIKHAP